MKLFIALLFSQYFYAQSTFNPNISLIGDIRLFNEKITPGKDTDFKFNGVELLIENYLNPYSKGWVNIHISDEEKIDIEEAYITIIKGLPLNSQLKLGRYFLSFGEVMQKHTHVFAFMDYPQMHQAYFGEEGTRNLGLELNFAFPLFDQFTELKLNVLEGNISPEGHAHGTEEHSEDAHEGEHEDHVEDIPGLAYNLYYSVFTEVSEYSNLKTSISYLYGGLDQEYEQFIKLTSFALKYKWQPLDYTFLEIRSEFFMNNRMVEEEHDEEELDLNTDEHHTEEVTNHGYFLSMNYQFNMAYNLGFSYSSYENPIEKHGDQYKDYSVFFGYAPFEESLLFRLKYSKDITRNSNRIELQTVFSLGPHKAHQF